MPSAAANNENAPMIQKNVPNQPPTVALSAFPSASRKEMSLARPSWPNTVA
jgi:hypothetical protein